MVDEWCRINPLGIGYTDELLKLLGSITKTMKTKIRNPSFSGLHLPFFNRLQSVGAASAAQRESMCG